MLAICLGAALLAPSSLPLAQLPSLGDGGEMNLGVERRLGERIARELYRDPDFIDDPVLVEYVQGIWQPLLAAARQRGDLSPELDQRFAWEIMLGRDRSINAFALPGGYLGLHLGLIGAATSRDELASVLAHELSHVTQRHISRLIGQQSKQAPLMIGAMILGAIVAGKNPEAGNAVIATGQALAVQGQLNFSRDMEREADRIGYGVLTQAGFDPQGFVTLFDKLQQASRHNDTGAFPYLRTHPLTTERMADMSARHNLSNQSGAVGAGLPAQAKMDHAMVSARARVLSSVGVDALRSWLVAPPDVAPQVHTQALVREAGVRYAATLAALRLRDFSLAKQGVARLLELTQADPQARRLALLLAAEVAGASNEPERATELLRDLQRVGTGARRPELLMGCQTLMAAGRASDAVSHLQTWVSLHPRDATAWQLLATALNQQGQTLRAIRADAEAQVAHLDYKAALDRFKAAQDWVRTRGTVADHVDASIIDTRARQVELLLREQTLER